ncbi:MAG: glycoside hydrolase family 65 protein [Spirochaetota bacterium]
MNKQWTITYENWNPEENRLREALCTLGNGYIATRGAMEESGEGEYNYPGTYVACGYNRAVSVIKEQEIENEDLVNWPNWLPLSFRIGDSPWLDLFSLDVREYVLCLDLKEGVLERKFRFRDDEGRETSVISRRIVSMHDPHVAALEWTIIPENWSGPITIRSAIDGSVQNNGVPRYGDLNGHHIDVLDTGKTGDGNIYLVSMTRQSKIRMAQVASTAIYQNQDRMDCSSSINGDDQSVEQLFHCSCEKLQPLRIEKIVTTCTTRDIAISDPLTEAREKITWIENFHRLYVDHRLSWEQIWTRSNINLHAEDDEVKILRLHIFHIHQTVSQHSISYDIGVPSRGWHGEAYRGHIFWDELYIFPYINMHNPELSRSLLMYRYRRLPRARQMAREAGYRGAMYPWQSGSNGREESQVFHLNPKSGRWIPDNSRLQRHISSAVAYNVWKYFQTTDDIDFLASYGAEVILSVALFWSSIAHLNPRRDRYEIHGVMGPDEYHTSYPDSEQQGINNNAYTNFMAVWVIRCALQLFEMFDEIFVKELSDKIGITSDDVAQWMRIAKRMYVPMTEDNIILQFEGFESLKEFDWDRYHRKYGTVLRLDRILEKENDTPNAYRATKQADVLMLFYLFSSEEIVEIFTKLGYGFTPADIPRNIAYYQKITSHGSTLSQVIFSWVYSRSEREESWSSFKKALMSDFNDIQGGTTPEGIHLGAMAGTVDLIQRCYTGMEIRDDVLFLNPRIPKEITKIDFHVRYRSHWIQLTITRDKLTVNFARGWSGPVTIKVRDTSREFSTNDTADFSL